MNTGVSAAQIALTNCPKEMRLARSAGGVTLPSRAGSAACKMVLPIPISANAAKYGHGRPAPPASGRSIAATVTASDTNTAFFRPILPDSTPVGSEMRKNHTKIIDGRNPAVTSSSAHSLFTWFTTGPTMSANPITKNPAIIGNSAAIPHFFSAVMPSPPLMSAHKP